MNAKSDDNSKSSEDLSDDSPSVIFTAATRIGFVVPTPSTRLTHAANSSVLLFTVRAGSVSHGADG
ncbi:MAG: hypothetical protein ABSE51_07530 [Terracidiphilus sp.]